ncbi:family 20 glycosylhydrolase [Flammeovirga sp. SubArs3]|uniref:glycoside hydrolase family 20 protein n=1 Tax=Flammeovirga sp. SubArs3 TaxID=2995316 RepID=UPI00248C287F|nr:family 20 glycosylhydrolase [Flammeovirga sp. SubArs3]
MKLLLLTPIILLIQITSVFGQQPSLVPQPKEIRWEKGNFILTENIKITKGNSDLPLDYFISQLKFQTGIQIKESLEDYADITLNIVDEIPLGEEAYILTVKEKNIDITAHNQQGLLHGLSTLLQLANLDTNVPCVDIHDAPKYPWRGLMLDVSRHFFTVDVIKEYLDLMAYYKLNKFHWHLTEDQGWRIEIKKYPKLTEIGAWRTESDGSKYGGFYSQEQIKEIVAYAAKRGIEVIPEIDMPGHMLGTLAAYPELSCTGGPFEVWTRWGVSKDVLCAGNEETYQFIEDILEEVIPLFPSKYFHVGGDECPKDRWKACDKCQLKIRTEDLKDEHELQSYFIHRIEKVVNENGKQIIGWDEILEGGLSPTATVQLWRDWHDPEAVGKIAKMGNDVIASPTSACYFDYDIVTTDVAQVYAYNPTPKGLSKEDQKHILGGECTVWTERIPDKNRIDFQVFPRGLAFSEALWQGTKEDGFHAFEERMLGQYPILDKKGVAFGPSSQVMEVTTEEKNEKLEVSANLLIDNVDLKYKSPDQTTFTEYKNPIQVTSSGEIVFQAFMGDKTYGDPEKVSFEIHKGNQAELSLIDLPSTPYQGVGVNSLIDGKLGNPEKFKNSNWIGFNGSSINATFQWKESINIKSIEFNAYDEVASWIMAPKEIEIAYSLDGSSFKKLKTKIEITKINQSNHYQVKFKKELKGVRALKLLIENGGLLPEEHQGAGNPSWLFVDEIIIK